METKSKLRQNLDRVRACLNGPDTGVARQGWQVANQLVLLAGEGTALSNEKPPHHRREEAAAALAVLANAIMIQSTMPRDEPARTKIRVMDLTWCMVCMARPGEPCLDNGVELDATHGVHAIRLGTAVALVEDLRSRVSRMDKKVTLPGPRPFIWEEDQDRVRVDVPEHLTTDQPHRGDELAPNPTPAEDSENG